MKSGASRGLTLIELVVVMAVFALVAAMGLQSLTGTLRLRDRLTTIAADTAALGHATALLRNDLSSAMPLLFFPPGKENPRGALTETDGQRGFSLSVGGQPGLPGGDGIADSGRQQRAEWRLDPDTGQLSRRSWPTLYPASANQQGGSIVVLDGVQSLRLRTFWAGLGWIEGVVPSTGNPITASIAGDEADEDQGQTASEFFSHTLPQALELTLDTRDHGRITLIEAFQ